jgi:hypothetical protein
MVFNPRESRNCVSMSDAPTAASVHEASVHYAVSQPLELHMKQIPRAVGALPSGEWGRGLENSRYALWGNRPARAAAEIAPAVTGTGGEIRSNPAPPLGA